MATKWKKCRVALCGISFILGLSILVGILSLFLSPFFRREFSQIYSLATETDYQNTVYFREDLLDDIAMFLDKASDYFETELYYYSSNNPNNYINNKKYEIRSSPELKNLTNQEKYLYEMYSNNTLIAYNSASVNLKTVSARGAYWNHPDEPSWKNASQNDQVSLENYNLLVVIKDGEIRVMKDSQERDLSFLGFISSSELFDDLTQRVDKQSFSGIRQIQLYLAVAPTPPATSYAYQYYLADKESSIDYLLGFYCILMLGLFFFVIPLFFLDSLKQAHLAAVRFLGKFPQKAKLAIAILAAATGIYLLIKSFKLLPNNSPALFVISFSILFWTAYWSMVICWFHRKRSPKEKSLRLLGWFRNLPEKMRKKALQKSLLRRTQTRLIRFWVMEAFICIVSVWFILTIQNGLASAPGFLVLALPFAVTALVGLPYFYRSKRMAQDLEQIFDQIRRIQDGEYTHPLCLPKKTEFHNVEESINDLQAGMSAAVEEQVHAERMKVDLIANVSHDIKTPLTSIISYVDLLQKEEGLAPHVKDYVKILAAKSERLRLMVQDVFELSKASSGNLQLNLECLDLNKLIRQTLADMEEAISSSSLLFRVSLPEEPVTIYADGGRMYRVFQNLIKNAVQYSLENSRVYIEVSLIENKATVAIKNISKHELSSLREDILERFVRGDASRTTEGSGLGLSIAKTFTEACGGSFAIASNADLFIVAIEFPVTQPAPNPSSGAQ